MKRLMIAIRISKNMKESRAISLALSLFLGNSVSWKTLSMFVAVGIISTCQKVPFLFMGRVDICSV